MTDNIDDKVINLFKKSSDIEDNKEQRFFKGFQYVKLTKDDNGNYFKEDSLREYAQKTYYIVSVMRNNGLSAAIYKYKVPYNSRLDSLIFFKNDSSCGEIIDIERYIPEDLA